MVPRDLLLVGPDEPAVADDLVAADVEPVDPMRCRQDEAGDRIGRAGELEPVGAPHGDVGPLARFERAAHRAEPGRSRAIQGGDGEDVPPTLERLSELGVGIRIDRFGTGRLSMRDLVRLPIQDLKIDPSLTRDAIIAAAAASPVAMPPVFATPSGMTASASACAASNIAALRGT